MMTVMQRVARSRGFTLIEVLLAVGAIMILAAVVASLPPRGDREAKRRTSCQSNLLQVGLAFMQYTQDYDEKYMPVAAGAVARSVAPFDRPYGWADSVLPYCHSPLLLQCPSEATLAGGTDAAQNGFTDYWMNANVSRTQLKDFASPTHTILCADGTDQTNARYSYKSLPGVWLKDEGSPAYRHLGVMNVLFADGHNKSIKASGIVTGTPRNSVTFAVK